MAQRIQQKRSSILGKRPDAAYLEPGELALNTNSATPGVFFETNDGSIAKAGPTYIGTLPPPTEVGYGNGETWYDEGNGTFNTYKAATEQWVPTLSPLFGGGITVIFVGTEFPEATDDLTNDGSARPFATLNRAAIEVARRSILPGRPDDPYNGRFLVILLPGENTVINDPGLAQNVFQSQVTPFTSDQPLTTSQLAQFNPVDGGLIFPRGTSIFGFDMPKTQIRPTYYPTWSRSLYIDTPEEVAPRTAQIKWTGNSFFNNVTFRDKPEEVSVLSISGLPTEVATCTSLQPHGYRALKVNAEGTIVAADTVTLSYSDQVSQSYDGESTTPAGEYYVSPTSPTQFTLIDVTSGQTILRNQLPEFPIPGSNPAEYFRLTYDNTTHHRLSCAMFATRTELNDFYFKVQVAFANIDFGGRVGNAEVAQGEIDIVAPVPETATQATNETSDSSPYLENVSLKSAYGQCGLSVDGALVEGFKSAQVLAFTSVTLQNDSDVYDVFYEGVWQPLNDAYAQAAGIAKTAVQNQDAMQYLDSFVPLSNIRFFYSSSSTVEQYVGSGSDAVLKSYSTGLPDDKSDTRHWTIKASNGGYCTADACYDVGSAVGFWAYHGGRLTLTGSQSSLGQNALRSEGFDGIGTDGGALIPDKGFIVQGLRRPLNVTNKQLTTSHQFIYLNQNIAGTTSTSITFENPVDEKGLLPFTLKPGTVIWVENPEDGAKYKATIAPDGLSEDKRTLSVLQENNTIAGKTTLELPYIRRFKDPRTPEQKSYQLIIGNSAESHRAPSAGKILRLSKSAESEGAQPLVLGRQFDPGPNGGWNQVFQVASSTTSREGNDPNHIRGDIQPSQQSSSYYIELKLCDSASPWVGNTVSDTNATGDYRYAQGQYTTYSQRGYLATANELVTGLEAPVPPSSESSWTLSQTTEVFQPTSLAYVPNKYRNAADPNVALYEEGDEYARGVQCKKDFYDLQFQVNEDDGSANLGLADSSGLYADSSKVDSPFSNSREAITRFLSLLGFTTNGIASMLQAQTWSNRELLINQFPSIQSGAGYALSVAEWPIEFNRPSSIICGNHTWELAGYLNYTKGLPEYQTSSLSSTLRYDNVETSIWGGTASYYGNTELGELVLYGVDIVGGAGQQVIL